MLEKPNVPDELIVSRLQEEYALRVNQLTFLPLGADLGTAVYRVTTEDGKVYFLKLRKGFEEISVTVPLLLKSEGIQEIIAPVEIVSKRGWADFGEYKIILYPYIEGKDGFEMELSDRHRRTLGTVLNGIHSTQIPPDLKRHIPQERFSPQWRESLKSSQARVENNTFYDPTAEKLVEFMKSKRSEIARLIECAERFASELQSQPLKFVLCHTDLHGGNILISTDGQLPVPAGRLYIVDWDNPLLAPKERDLMFIGGGIDEIWKSERDIGVFYEGYGKTDVSLSALAYYRYERIVEDLAVICEQLLLTNEGGADRERSLSWFRSNFEPGGTIEIADRTVDLLETDTA